MIRCAVARRTRRAARRSLLPADAPARAEAEPRRGFAWNTHAAYAATANGTAGSWWSALSQRSPSIASTTLPANGDDQTLLISALGAARRRPAEILLQHAVEHRRAVGRQRLAVGVIG